MQQVKFSKNGSLVAIAAEGQGVGVITTDDWQCLWENWSEQVDQRRVRRLRLLDRVPEFISLLLRPEFDQGRGS